MTNNELEACIAQYGTDVYSFCRQLTQNRQEADDLYQDTFLKATEQSGKINYAGNPKSYLLSVALRIWKNRTRKYAWRMRIAPVHPMAEGVEERMAAPCERSPEEQILKQEEIRQIRQAVGHLPNRLKIPVLLYYMEELPIAEIASVLHIPSGTVKSRLYQARTRLKKELEVIWDEKNR